MYMDNSKLGYNKPLYILPFDHRSIFAQKMFNLQSISELNEDQRHSIKEFKMLVYKGFKEAVNNGVQRDYAAILCDEEFGSEVLIDAKHNGFVTILTIEKSGSEEFEFQYGEDFGDHINKYKPEFTKVLIKYNPADSEELKQRQKNKLKILSDYSHENKYKFLSEVLVLPTKEQLDEVNGNREEYDMKIRPGLTVEVIKDLHSSGIEPDVWKLEGFDSEESYKEIVETAQTDGREKVGLVILGRGADEEKVDEWLKIGSKVKGVTGFAVGRTVFWDSLEKFYKGEIGKAEAIKTIGANYQNFCNIFTGK